MIVPDSTLLVYALATAASGLLAKGGGPGTVLVRTRVGTATGIEGLRFLLGPASPPTAIGWSPPHSCRASLRPISCSLQLGWLHQTSTKLPELLGRCVLRVPSCTDIARSRETGHECSCCVTIADTVSVTAEMQRPRAGRTDASVTLASGAKCMPPLRLMPFG